MADHISRAIAALTSRGWPRDYLRAKEPCWYCYAKGSVLDERLEDPDYAPSLEGRESRLVIAPPTVYSLYVDVSPTGELGNTRVEVHDGQGPMEDGTAGEIPAWPGLEEVLAQARLIYLQWEVQQLREASHG